jgi:hypothetical protein
VTTYRVAGHTGDLGGRVRDDLAVLHVHTADLGQRARLGAIARDELSDERELLGGVDDKARASTEEALVAHAVRLQTRSRSDSESSVILCMHVLTFQSHPSLSQIPA